MNTKQRNNKVKYMGCIICELYFGIDDSPSDLHHITEGGRRVGDDHTIPLCPEHHRHGNYSVSRADGKKAFEEAYRSEYELLEIINNKIGYICKSKKK